MSLPDATIDLNLPADHPDHLQEGESILLNVNAFRPLENVHIRLGTARMDNLPKIRSNTTQLVDLISIKFKDSINFYCNS